MQPLIFDFCDDREVRLQQTEADWTCFVRKVFVGQQGSGVVCAVAHYGVYLDFGEKFPVLIEVPNLSRGRFPITVEQFPQKGQSIFFDVIQLVTPRRLVRATEAETSNLSGDS